MYKCTQRGNASTFTRTKRRLRDAAGYAQSARSDWGIQRVGTHSYTLLRARANTLQDRCPILTLTVDLFLTRKINERVCQSCSVTGSMYRESAVCFCSRSVMSIFVSLWRKGYFVTCNLWRLWFRSLSFQGKVELHLFKFIDGMEESGV